MASIGNRLSSARRFITSGRFSGWTPALSIMPLALMCFVASLVGPASSLPPPAGSNFKIPGNYSNSSSTSCVWNITNTASTNNGGAVCGTVNSNDDTGVGVYGAGTTATGVHGNSNTGIGVYGTSITSDGVRGISNTNSGAGVSGYSSDGIGVYANTGNSNSYAGFFIGNVYVTGTVIQNSDARYKTDITTLPNALDKILALRGVSFDWRQKEFPNMHFGKAQQIGFVAQEVEKVLPEIVSKDKQGYRGVNYTAVVPVLVEAIKEQQKQIEDLKAAFAHR